MAELIGEVDIAGGYHALIGRHDELCHLGREAASCIHILAGETPPPVLLGLPEDSLRISLPFHLVQPGGAVHAGDLLDLAESAVPERPDGTWRPPVVVVTGTALATRECASLLGFSDRRRQLAAVSLAGLGQPGTEEEHRPGSSIRWSRDALLRRRIQNLIAHESGHLRGLAHCSNPGCLMKPVKAARELDERSFAPCGHCPPVRWWTPLKETLISSIVGIRTVSEQRTP